MKRSETLVLGIAIGAAVTYLLDPDRGARRRALVRDKLVHAGHEVDDAARAGARHVRNRARGIAHETRARLTERDVDDPVLEERVRSEIGRKFSHGDIQVSAGRGHVTLRGRVNEDELDDVVRTTKRVRGVESVENELQPMTDNGNTRETARS